jgi:hypothetical protein
MRRRTGVAETIIISLVVFLGTGIYNMYKVHNQTVELREQRAKVESLQNKYCNIQNPTYEQQAVCIEILKTNVQDGK